jgi:Pyrimidine dimer DNA glycosylase
MMNIFYVDEDPVKAAECLVDKHVVKMILESAQLLSTAHRVLDGEMTQGIRINLETGKSRKVKAWVLPDAREHVIYAATHMNHPSAIWCRQSVENYLWLVEHFFALMNEYIHRYKKIHACNGELSYMLQSPPFNLKEYDMTPMPSAMDDQYIVSKDSLTNYRNYYKLGKVKFHQWTNRQPPEWING